MRQFKRQYRELYYEQLENDKHLIEKHEGVVQLDHKVRKMKHQLEEQQVKEEQAKGNSDNANFIANKLKMQRAQEKDSKRNQQALERLKQEIEETSQQRTQEKRILKKKLVQGDAEVEELEHDVKVLELQVREKEQESRLAEIKLKELRRAIRHKTLKPIVSESPKGVMVRGKNG